MTYEDPQDLYEWALDNIGHSFKRPKGKLTYTIREVEFIREPYITLRCICDTPDGEREMSPVGLRRMVAIDR